MVPHHLASNARLFLCSAPNLTWNLKEDSDAYVRDCSEASGLILVRSFCFSQAPDVSRFQPRTIASAGVISHLKLDDTPSMEASTQAPSDGHGSFIDAEVGPKISGKGCLEVKPKPLPKPLNPKDYEQALKLKKLGQEGLNDENQACLTMEGACEGQQLHGDQGPEEARQAGQGIGTSVESLTLHASSTLGVEVDLRLRAA